MSREWTFEKASAFLSHWSGKDSEAAGIGDEYFEAEEFLLGQVPRTPLEASVILGLVLSNIETGGRSDGRDICALKTLQKIVLEWEPAGGGSLSWTASRT